MFCPVTGFGCGYTDFVMEEIFHILSSNKHRKIISEAFSKMQPNTKKENASLAEKILHQKTFHNKTNRAL